MPVITNIEDLQVTQFTGGTTFIVQNAAAVDVNFLIWTVSMSRALLPP